MAALTDKRLTRETRLKHVLLPLKAGQKVFQGGIAMGDPGLGQVVKGGTAGTNPFRLGEFDDNVDNSAGTGTIGVLINLDKEVVARWYDNDTGANAVVAASVFNDVNVLDDHTVTLATGVGFAGRVWRIDSVKGVLIEQYKL